MYGRIVKHTHNNGENGKEVDFVLSQFFTKSHLTCNCDVQT
jgi:hypothetical protein